MSLANWAPLLKAGLANVIPPELLSKLGNARDQMALSMVPGSGIADYAGQMPDASSVGGTGPVTMMPSFEDNVAKGNYLDAFLQTAGVAGDAATALPAVGLAVGATMRAPKGLANAIKAFGATGQQAKRIEAGIAKLKAGKTPTAPQLSAVEEAARGGFTQARNALEATGARPVGAPVGIANQADLGAWREKWKGFYDAGADNADWYKIAADTAARGFGGDVERAAAFNDAVAAASQRTRVGIDADTALRAQYRAEYDRPIGGLEHIPAVEQRIKDGYEMGSPMAVGGKVGQFSQAIASGGEMNPNTGVWDSIGMDGAGFDPAKAKAGQVGRFLDPETQRLADVTNAGKEEAFLPTENIHDAQARGWAGIKKDRYEQEKAAALAAGREPPPPPTGNYTYADWSRERSFNFNNEARPGKTTALAPMFDNIDPKRNEEFFSGWREANTDELGNDLLAKNMGFMQFQRGRVQGIFGTQQNPANAVSLVVPQMTKGPRPLGDAAIRAPSGWKLPKSYQQGTIDPHSMEMVTGYAVGRAMLDMQDAVAGSRLYPVENLPISSATAWNFDLGRAPTDDEVKAFYAEAQNMFDGAYDIVPLPTSNGVNLLYFNWVRDKAGKRLSPEEWDTRVEQIADRVFGDGKYDTRYAQDARMFIDNDWKGSTDASAYQAALDGSGPEVAKRVRGLLSDQAYKQLEFYDAWARDQGQILPDEVKKYFAGLSEKYVNPNTTRPRFAGLAGRHLIPGVASTPFMQGRSRAGLAYNDPFELK